MASYPMDIKALLDKLGLSYLAEPLLLQVLLVVLTTVLANFFGGLTIYLDRPSSVGDWIRTPDKQIEGTVEYISKRHTRVRAFNKNPIYVPNTLFTTNVVENPSRMTHRRINETIGIRYEDIGMMGTIVTEVKTMLQNHAEIDATQTMIVNFNIFGPPP